MKNLKKWKLLRSQIVFQNRWCQVRQDEVELPNGQFINDYFVNVRPDIALVFPLTKNQEIVFVRQYRHGVREILLELPAGTFKADEETPESAAMRELKEETGYTCERLLKLATLYDNPVKDTNTIHLFFAADVEKTEQQILDLTEEIEIVLIPISQVLEKITSGEICVAGTVAAIFLGLNFLNQSGWQNFLTSPKFQPHL